MFGSFRDPAGFVFREGERLYRCVRTDFAEDYDQLMQSGLYDAAVAQGGLIPHEEIQGVRVPDDSSVHRVLEPQRVPFVSYPYEWCPSQLLDAARLTLRLARLALRHDMTLKDASAYNIQFLGTRPVFIDTTSFARLPSGTPWLAYHQFCKHFLAPLWLTQYSGESVLRELRTQLDGMDLGGVSRRLPLRSWCSPKVLAHLHVQALAGRAASARRSSDPPRSSRSSQRNQLAFFDHLERLLDRLRVPCGPSAWRDYDKEMHYKGRSLESKHIAVESAIEMVTPKSVWDLGANIGRFSRLASQRGIDTLAIDGDAAAVERCYRRGREDDDPRLLPLCLDLVNPSPSLGWENRERLSWIDRGPCDLALALALIHHLVLGSGIPLQQVASGLRRIARHLLIEWVPPTDEKVALLRDRRPGGAPAYDRDTFESAFARCYEPVKRFELRDSDRCLILFAAKA